MIKVKYSAVLLIVLLVLPCAAFSKSSSSKNSAVQSTETIKRQEEAKDIFSGMSVYTIGEDDDEEEVYEKALLDAKRDAVEQAGTYIEITTNMRNYEITTDDVKVLSAAIVKMIPGSVKEQVVSEREGIKTIRLEAKYHVDTRHLEQGLFPGRQKDLQVSVSRDFSKIVMHSVYTIFKNRSTYADMWIAFLVSYNPTYQLNLSHVDVIVNRTGENEVPVVISVKHPVKLKLENNGALQELSFRDNVQMRSGESSSLSCHILPDFVVSLMNYNKVILEFYQKDGKTYEIVIPRKVLNQWREMIVNPQKIVAEYEE